MADSLQHIALQRHLENTYSRELPALDRCKQNAITADKRIRFEQEVGASVAYQMPCHVSHQESQPWASATNQNQMPPKSLNAPLLNKLSPPDCGATLGGDSE